MGTCFMLRCCRRLPASRLLFFLFIFFLLFFRLAAQARDTVPGCALPEDSASLAGVGEYGVGRDSAPDACRVLLDSIQRVVNKVSPQLTLPLAQKTCETCKSIYGIDSQEFMESLDVQANIYAYLGNISKALEYKIEVVGLFLALGLDKDDYDYFRIVNGLGSLYFQVGRYQKGIEVLEENRVRMTQKNADTSITYANNCSMLGQFYAASGEFKKAVPILNQAENYYLKNNDTLNPFYPIILANTGTSFLLFGDIKKAEFYIRRSVNLYLKLGLADHPFCLMAKSYLAMGYMQLNANERALEILRADVERIQKSPQYSMSNGIFLSTYSTLLMQCGNFEKADSIFLLALSILEKSTGKNSQPYLVTLGNLSASYFQQNKVEEAIDLCTKALQGFKLKAGVSSIYGVLILSNKKANRHDTAKGIISGILSFVKQGAISSSLDYHHFLMYAIPCLTEPDDTNLLRQCSELYFPNITDFTCHNFPILSEKEKLLFLEKNIWGLQSVLTTLFSSPLRHDPTIARHVYNTALALKGILLDDMTRSCDAIAARGDATLQEDYSEWKGNRQLLTKQYSLDSLRRQFPVEYLDSLRRRTDALEIDLMRRSTPLRQRLQAAEWQDVRDRLNADEAAVEFIHFRTPRGISEFSDSVLYCALVLRKDWDAPRLVWLFEEAGLRRLLGAKGSSPIQEFEYAYLGPKNRMYQLVWQPLDSFLNGVRRVYFAPDGLLHRVAFAGVACPGAQLLGERYDLQMVGSTRDILLLGEAAPDSPHTGQPGAALLAGGIGFDVPEGCAPDSRQKDEAVSDPDPGRGRQSYHALAPLPGSRQEVYGLDSLLRAAGITTTLLTDCAASELNLKQFLGQSPSPRFLHLSTHGMIHPAPVPRSVLQIDQLFPDNPLHYASLAFAGYNRKATGQAPLPGMGDGEMYASEFRDFDLSDTELVTLSACGSGLGATPGSEGMFGLQRAFRLAGAKHVLATIYAVNDVPTALFMGYLYQNLLSGVGVRDALRLAQIRMRQHPRYGHPFYWAGFVLL